MGQTVFGGEFEKGATSVKKIEDAKKKPAVNKKQKHTKGKKTTDELREIPLSEFFEKNRHILGFDNPVHSLITSVKEGVDNSLDACEQDDILPNIVVEIKKIEGDELRISIEDNGPGIVEKEIPNVFGRLLYGSRFGSGKQSRGQQGIGISAAIMYGQLTTGRSATVTSKVESEECATRITMKLDISKNRGIVDNALTKKIVWREENNTDEFGVAVEKESGTRIEFALKGKYREGRPSVFEYIKSTAIVNPHASIIFIDPSGNKFEFGRISNVLPNVPKISIKPHPKGVEIGQLMRMAHETKTNRMGEFLRNEFSSLGKRSIENILEKSNVDFIVRPNDLSRGEAKNVLITFQEMSLRGPSSDTLIPIGEKLIKLGLKNVLEEIRPEFYTAPVSRKPSVFAGTPFIVEVGMAYGGNIPRDHPVRILRFANRVPLLYQAGGCAITKAIQNVNWRQYGLEQRGGRGTPNGPVIMLVHLASTNIPFTSEAKEAIANIPEIEKEIKLALRSNAKLLKRHLSKQKKREKLSEKFELVQKVLPAIAEKTSTLLGMPVPNLDKVIAEIMDVVLIEEEMNKEAERINVRIKVTNFRKRSANFKLRIGVPNYELEETVPRPGKREERYVIWSVGLPSTETSEYKFKIDLQSDKEYEGVEIWTEGIDSKYVIGGESWTGIPKTN